MGRTSFLIVAAVLAAAGCGDKAPQPVEIETLTIPCGGTPGAIPPRPGADTCVTDPRQGCPPELLECSGKCQCLFGMSCAQGETFDTAPDVCACVPATGTPPPAEVRCGGLAGTPCPGADQCLDDPSDDCDPAHGGADCGGVCHCAGGIRCVASGTAFDGSPGVCACLPKM